jgi:metallo-beta-lactamase family protein
VGRLPLLVKNGYDGFFYSTPPTVELTRLILEDAYTVMEYDHRHFGRPLLYTIDDVEKVMSQFKKIEYHKTLTLENKPSTVKKILKLGKTSKKSSGVEIMLRDAGHIFGSAFVEVKAEGKKVIFSGDVGNVNVPILKETEALPADVDLLICESTYGDRKHESSEERGKMLQETVVTTGERGGVLMIPSFALERTQELLYELNDLVDRHHSIKTMPVYLDSPLAIDALKVFKQFPEYYDQEANGYIKDGDDIFDFSGLTLTYTRDESMKINHTVGSKVIIAGAGMMNGGRIMHHALRYLSDHRNTLLIIGYQSPGTLGWKILNGAPKVDVLGERVSVNCGVKMINAFSAHGDKDKLFEWITNGGKHPKNVVLNHGDKVSSLSLAELLKMNGINAEPADAEKVIKI